VSEPTDPFQKLEEKIAKLVELYKRALADSRTFAHEIEKLKAEGKDGTREREQLEREVHTLRRERDEVRQRVEKLLAHMEALTRVESAG